MNEHRGVAATSDAPLDLAAERKIKWSLFAACAAMAAAGIALPYFIGASISPSPLALGNVSEAHIVEIRNNAGATVLTGEFRSRVDVLGNTEKDAALSDRSGRKVIGEVEIEIPAPGRENRRTELEVDVIGLAPRETFVVVIDDRVVGTFTTDDRGSVDKELQEGEVAPAEAPSQGAS